MVSQLPTTSKSSTNQRIGVDVCRLVSKYEVKFIKGMKEFVVCFSGPNDSPYEGGTWAIRIAIPSTYPFSSPSVGFVNKIYHPNVDESSGSVCLDVINQRWSSIFDLCHIFDHFLPQLLQEPNISDPLNQAAAHHFGKDHSGYCAVVKDYINRYASPDELIKVLKNVLPECTDEELSCLSFISSTSLDLSLKSNKSSLLTLNSTSNNLHNTTTSFQESDCAGNEEVMLSDKQEENFEDEESSLSEYTNSLDGSEDNNSS